MATLEMVRLRSKYPNTGRMTIRHPMPLIDAPMGEVIDIPIDADLDVPAAAVEQAEKALREVLTDSATEATTAPQVAAPDADGETTAREGRHAR